MLAEVYCQFPGLPVVRRWLRRRLPGFTRLVCKVGRYVKADPYHHYYINREGAEAAAWLATQLPKMSVARLSGNKLQLGKSEGVRPSTQTSWGCPCTHIAAFELDVLLLTFNHTDIMVMPCICLDEALRP